MDLTGNRTKMVGRCCCTASVRPWAIYPGVAAATPYRIVGFAANSMVKWRNKGVFGTPARFLTVKNGKWDARRHF
jgi:hypothetical protein